MRFSTTLTLLAALLLSTTSALHANELKSGLQVGDYPFAYYVSDITGPHAGQQLCYRCKYGPRPVINIFTRDMDEKTVRLVKEIDKVVADNRDDGIAAFVVVLSDKPTIQESKLRRTAERHGIRHTPVTVFNNAAGPGKYKLCENADVTVLMWVEDDVKVNHAFRLADLSGSNIAKVVSDTRKILN